MLASTGSHANSDRRTIAEKIADFWGGIDCRQTGCVPNTSPRVLQTYRLMVLALKTFREEMDADHDKGFHTFGLAWYRTRWWRNSTSWLRLSLRPSFGAGPHFG